MKRLWKSVITTFLIFSMSTLLISCTSKTSTDSKKEKKAEILYPIKEEKDGKILYGYINKNGEKVIDCKYDFAHEFSHGIAKV